MVQSMVFQEEQFETIGVQKWYMWYHHPIVVHEVALGEATFRSLHECILYEYHDAVYSGHIHIFETHRRIQLHY